MKYYGVLQVDGKIRAWVGANGKSDRYTKPKYFDSYKKAATWCTNHSYKGMSFHYEVKEIPQEEIDYWDREARRY